MDHYLVLLMIIAKKSKQTSVRKKFVILQSIGIIAIKVVKQGQSSTSADILVDNLIPIIQLND